MTTNWRLSFGLSLAMQWRNAQAIWDDGREGGRERGEGRGDGKWALAECRLTLMLVWTTHSEGEREKGEERVRKRQGEREEQFAPDFFSRWAAGNE